jgi:hypothetical protein
MATTRGTKRTRTWVVSFNVEAPVDYSETDITEAVEQALDGGVPLSARLDATIVTAMREGA